MKKVLITGAAGFIGYHLVNKLLDKGFEVVGLDNINDYYDINLKYGRLTETGIIRGKIEYGTMVQSSQHIKYRFVQIDLSDKQAISDLFDSEKFDGVVNLAAQAGVRYSLINPHAYTTSNVTGFLNILEGCRAVNVKHLVYASTSSVYGLNTNMPLSTSQATEHPITLYAATKKANELMAHSYSHLFGIPSTGVRFFTVYGPWGRPDMALFLFTNAILKGEPIQVFNNGEMIRDFTYVDDIAEGLSRILIKPAQPLQKWTGKYPNSARSSAPYRIINIGNSNPIKLISYIEAIEEALGSKAIKNMMPIQPGDVPATHADVADLIEDYDYKPATDIKEGVKNFTDWYRKFFNI